jgi:hypothetical protein
MVPGATRRWARILVGSRRIKAARTRRPSPAVVSVGATEYGDLMPQHQQLDVLDGGCAIQ